MGGFSGQLWRHIDDRIRTARESGALCPMATEHHRVESGPVQFSVHVLGAARSKLAALESQRRSGSNPFLHPEPELVVGQLPPSHDLLLNKFPVLDRHVLLVTRDFEPQSAALSSGDFAAVSACLDDGDGLVFFNSSTVAGASQIHKHLQLVPLPIGFGPGRTPIEHLLEKVPRGEIGRVPALGFAHQVHVCGDPPSWIDREQMQRVFQTLFGTASRSRSEHPFNLLLTRRWMMLVPRRRECFEGISVNALGFVGSLLVRDRSELERVREVGPLTVLSAVAGVDGQD